MRRGGFREGSGRKSEWSKGGSPTTPIRVPDNLVKRVLEYAHMLDRGEIIEFAQNQTELSEQLSGIVQRWQSKVEGKESSPRWSNVNKLLLELQALLTK
jgi:hypothetical protein